MARANLTGAPGSGISGTVEVTERTGGVGVTAHVTGVKQTGPLGFHLHEVGACTPPDFESAGEHFNPGGAPHACSPTSPRHAGDLGNLEVAAGGEGHLDLETDLLTVVDGPASVVGRAVVLHAGKDDCTTQPSGDSGDRIACGVFERVTR
jgi:Cu-Zn family superoxide dismutase